MSIPMNPLWLALDAFHADLPVFGANSAIGRLVASLAHHRAAMGPDTWKASCAGIDRHPAVTQLMEDPYSRDARTKPAGYAGDARTLDYVYLQDPGPQPVTATGRTLFEVSTGVPIAAAVRDRCESIADEIAQRASGRTIRVASLACGHARELDRIPLEMRQRIRFWALDQDPKSIAHCRDRHHCAQTTFEVGSVRDVIAGRVRIPPSDFVYASGLFDYLDQRAGAVLLKRMFASVERGGSLVVPNLTPENEEIGYMEAVMDWWMCYRTADDMRELASVLDVKPDQVTTSIVLRANKRVAWLQIDRLAP